MVIIVDAAAETCNSQIHSLKSSPPKMMLLESEAFGRGKSREGSVSYPVGSLPPCGGTAGRHWLWIRKNALTRDVIMLAPQSWTPQPSELWETNVVCKLPRLWYVVAAAHIDQDSNVVFWYMLLKNSASWDKCSRLVHWEDPEGWDGEGGGRGDRDGEHM